MNRYGALFFSFVLVTLICAGPLYGQEKFPTRPIEYIVPAAPGGGADIVSRILADATEQFLGQKIVVINRPGASGSIGLSEIAGARPDGYKIGLAFNGPMTLVPHILQVPYTIDSFTPIMEISEFSSLFCVRPDFPAKTAKEFFEYVKKNPMKVTYGNDGIGNTGHMSAEMIFQAMGVKLRPVPYSGVGDVLKGFLGGQIDVYNGSLQPILPYIETGKARCLFCSTKKGVDAAPGMLTVVDLGIPQAETLIWRGVFGPKGLPADRLAILEKAFQQGARSEKFTKNPAMDPKTGERIVALPGKQFEKIIRAEYAAMGAMAKQLGLVQKK